MKLCSKCQEIKTLDFFTKDKYRPDGLKIYCRPCCKNYYSKYASNNVNKLKTKRREYYLNNRVTEIAKSREWNLKNYDLVKKRVAKTILKNRDKYNNTRKEKYKTNADLRASCKHLATLRKHSKKQRTPKWLSKHEKLAIYYFYRNCPKGYHVDHIIPLNGKIVSGLHVLNNLQYLPAKENLRKSNKF